MRDLQRYANECIKDMEAIGIKVPAIKNFTVNKRAKHRYGQCRYDIKSKTYSININSDLLDEECNVMALRETIFHEIIHTLPKCMNHGSEFKKYAEKVNKAYKVNITRCSTMEEKYGEIYAKKLKERNMAAEHTSLYELYCNHCKKIRASGAYKRIPKWYKNPERYHCSVCGGSLERVGISPNVKEVF